MEHFTYQQKVLFQHCDPAGIVFYPRYFEMLNQVVEEWFEVRLDHSFVKIHDVMRAAVPTVSIDIEFMAASRHGDRLEFTLVAQRIGGASLDITITAACDGQARLAMNSRLVFMDQGTGKSALWPEVLRAKIEAEINLVEDLDA